MENLSVLRCKLVCTQWKAAYTGYEQIKMTWQWYHTGSLETRFEDGTNKSLLFRLAVNQSSDDDIVTFMCSGSSWQKKAGFHIVDHRNDSTELVIAYEYQVNRICAWSKPINLQIPPPMASELTLTSALCWPLFGCSEQNLLELTLTHKKEEWKQSAHINTFDDEHLWCVWCIWLYLECFVHVIKLTK